MNDQQLDHKVRKDAEKVTKDLKTLLEHSALRVGRIEGNVSQVAGKAQKNVSTWVENGVSHVSKRIEKLADHALESGLGAAATVKKDVGHGMKQYNAKAQDVANHGPEGFGKNTARYPWVAISITIVVAIGFLVGILLKPSPQTVG